LEAKDLHNNSRFNPLPTIEEAESLNKFFTRFNEDAHKDTTYNKELSTNKGTAQINIMKEDVVAMFKSIKNSTSSGPSSIPAWFFKEHAHDIAEAYTRIYSNSFKTSVYPSCWKQALVTACPKSSDAIYSNPKLYRPIAVTPIQARVLDKLALKQIDKTMKCQEDPNQYAYKANRCTTDALVMAVDFILKTLDTHTGSAVKAIFLDYSSAFNTVLQKQLIQKIDATDSNAASWLKSYMEGWSQGVKAKKKKFSSLIDVTVGIPQGGPLSAKLFTYMTDDINTEKLLIQTGNGNLIKYSDDTMLMHRIMKTTAQIDQSVYQKHVQQIAETSESKNLKLNETKCEEMTFHHCNIKNQDVLTAIEQNLTINGKDIRRAEQVKYLGLMISRKMNWTAHVNHVVKKVNWIVKGLARIVPYLNVDKKLMIFKQIIVPNILYASEVWGAAILRKDRKKIKKLVSFYSTIASLDKKMLILILNDQHQQRFHNYVEKIKSDPNHPMHNQIVKQLQNHYSTRHQIKELYCRTKKYQSSFLPTAISYMCNRTNATLI
jgi:hypothetical protein